MESDPHTQAPHHGPWREHWRGWRPGQGPPPWVQWQGAAQPDWRRKRRRIFMRLLGVLGLLLFLIVGSMAVLAWHLTRLMDGGHPTVLLVWIAGIGLTLALPLLSLALAARVFRSYALPLTDIMEAADAVATGNLAVRVQERGSPDFQRLAHSFNRMTEELARTDQQRRNLTADVAHELRTPLHIIQGNLEGILDGVYAPTPEHIEATLQETRTLARLVDDLRTLSLAESGQLPLVKEPVDVGDLLADVVTSFSAQAEGAGVTLQAVAPQTTADQPGAANDSQPPLILHGDAGRLDQVLSNLVANAVRHTPPGGAITLQAVQADGRVRITVADTGEGIAPDDLPFIFDRFWRADRARGHSSGAGSGLGLAIANQLVKAHGGEIKVSSELGKGTTFVIELPA
ncbi:MAG TPA: HAMP domain-containing sensor histidine kinase [Caldilineaceae bacterium]|nr:HAMP domain-containing sensor histidine kinase [Caldilineaceae bacterium]